MHAVKIKKNISLNLAKGFAAQKFSSPSEQKFGGGGVSGFGLILDLTALANF